MNQSFAEMSPCGKTVLTIVAAVIIIGLIANARDIGKYLKLKAMSRGAVKP